MSELIRRVSVVVLLGPIVVFFGSLWFSFAAPIAFLTMALMPNREWWGWLYAWSFSTAPFFGFWCMLTGYQPPREEFWHFGA